ncbi:flavodoxin [Streptomyces sp. CC53]|uniref:flavodoxin domain-containing protein n=1 Tax=unclassified Streptomyces TaxID=2593676 RepID=UPI0008DDE3D9|nr:MULTISPECIES: flavodoxin domain-containing protein [unclassified Streptomyces]OII62519.1 flavodoxin [Streptomyces sp. CC53]
MKRVLVTYGSRHGATEGIAEEIADTLREDGYHTSVVPADDVVDVTGYDGVVLGGALYAGHWHHDALRCARRNAEALGRRPVWMFSSGPLDDSAAEEDIPPVRGVEREMERLHAREHVTFGGSLSPTVKGFMARALVRQGHAGDHRDTDRIRAWAHHIATELAEGPPRTQT